MHPADVRIDEIVKVGGPPSHARGRAASANGRTHACDANLAHGHTEEARIFVRRPTNGKAMDPATRIAQAIHDRPGFTDVARREREAIAAFECERATVCRRLLRPGWNREPWGERIDIGAPRTPAADRDMDIRCQARLHCGPTGRTEA